MTDQISISPEGSRWAIKHGAGFLGYVDTRDEAERIAGGLVNWIVEQGRSASPVSAEPRSFSSTARGFKA
jgi:hypothetical protein